MRDVILTHSLAYSANDAQGIFCVGHLILGAELSHGIYKDL